MSIGFKQKMIALAVVVLIIVAGISVYFLYIAGKEKKTITPIEETKLDDRVSPNVNQGLIVEILRIRNRELLDKINKLGMSWRDKPSFYWITYVDGKEGNSKGNIGTNGVYKQWDTIGEESSVSFFVEQEQKKSEVIIKILEIIETGLIFKKKNDIEKETIVLSYDYRTGRWSGDDSFEDKDGYGHYLGETFEIWFNIYQSDYDNDGIPYWTEVNILHTNANIDDSYLDPDDDGIPTSWEWRWGYDPFVWNDHKNLDPDVDGIDNTEEYQMKEWFADPYQPDIYIETDGMQKKGFFDVQHVFFKESQQMLIERFAQHGINVYIDDGWPDGPINGGGEMLPFVDSFDDTSGKQGLSFYLHNFADERKGIFRYVIIGNKAGLIHPSFYNKYDTIILGENLRSILLTRRAFSPRQIMVCLAKGVLHELGHSIGLMPYTFPGNDILPRNLGDRYPNMPDDDYARYVEQYHSIMNYDDIFNDRDLFDYSDGGNGPPYDFNDWEHIYLPTFEIDMINFEEPTDETFEDIELVNKYPGVTLEGWEFDKNLTEEYLKHFKNQVFVKNVDCNISVYVKKDIDDTCENNIRIYAMPNVYPVYSIWSLISEGKIDKDDTTIDIYSQKYLIDSVLALL